MNGLEINKNDFQKMEMPQMMEVVYDNLVDMRKDIKVLKKKKWWNATASFGGGIIGGALAALGFRVVK